jgi:hypothetical protein
MKTNHIQIGDNIMFEKIKTTLSSREFQTGAGQVAIMVTTVVVSSMVSKLTSQALNTGLEALMDKIHGSIEEITAE